MGNSSPQQATDLLLDRYQLLREEDNLRILEDPTTDETYALREKCFAIKQDYEKAFRQLTQQEPQHCQNQLHLIKLWSREHNGLCSSLYKIFTVYEYPRVRLHEQIEAREKQEKYFEQTELFSILQSCLNALRGCPIVISPQRVFIVPQGILKVIHPHLIQSDPSIYSADCYYSPEHIQNFNQIQSSQDIQRETIFSIGMTVLHSALLKSPLSCYEITLKRFNNRKLQVLLSSAAKIYSPVLLNTLSSMLQIDPFKRSSINDTQTLINSYFSSSRQTMIGSHPTQPKRQEDSLKVDSFNIGHNLVSMFQNDESAKRQPLQAIGDLLNREELLPKSHHILQKTKKSKKNANQNLYTEAKIFEMIKMGVEKINQRIVLQTYVKPLQGPAMLSGRSLKDISLQSSKDLSEYEIISSQKGRCLFVEKTYQDGSRYQGMTLGGFRHGYGKITYPDGVYYEGNFRNNRVHGKGTLYYGSDRPAYNGEWAEDLFHGKGILYNQYPCPILNYFDYHNLDQIRDGWLKYEGDFAWDEKQGYGKLFLTNGQNLEGRFYKGRVEGEAIFTNIDGEKIKGIWRSNALLE